MTQSLLFFVRRARFCTKAVDVRGVNDFRKHQKRQEVLRKIYQHENRNEKSTQAKQRMQVDTDRITTVEGELSSREKLLIKYNQSINQCKKSRSVKKAMKYLNEMREKNLTPDVFTYTSVIHVCNQAFDFPPISGIVRTMKQEAIEPNIVTFNALISANSRQGQWKEALSLLREIRSKNIQPTLITYNTCIGACAKAGEIESAISLFREMKSSGVDPDDVTVNSLLRACGRDWRQALTLFNSMMESGFAPDAITYSTLMKVCYDAQQYDEVQTIFQKMRDSGLKPDLVNYSSVLASLAKTQKLEAALEIYDEMVKVEITPDVVCMNSVMHTAANCGDVKRTLQIFQKLCQMFKPTMASYQILLGVLVEQEMWDVVDKVYSHGHQLGILGHWSARQENVVDLHGFSRNMAVAAIRHVFLYFLEKPVGFDINLPDPFYVIVGRGNHSKEGAVLPHTIERALKEVFQPPINCVRETGRIRLDPKSVKEWLRNVHMSRLASS